MYKYLLCWRYLRTRYIALASIVSVTLGVATMIIVNAVMGGFSDKMRDRIHGALSDIIIESTDNAGFGNSDVVMARIRTAVGADVEAMAPAIETIGMIQIWLPNGEPYTQPVKILGVRPEERAKVGSFDNYIYDDSRTPKHLPASFDVPESLRMASPAGKVLAENAKAGGDPEDEIDKALRQNAADAVPDRGAILGYALATFHHKESHSDIFLAPRGSRISLTFPRAGKEIRAATDTFTTVGFYKSDMSEYDASYVFVPLEHLQYMRGVGDGKGEGRVNQILIKTRPGADLDVVADKIRGAVERIRPSFFRVATWEEKQGNILAAVQVEQSILNILLFFIIAVAGFGILAIFSMIVVEKTRDIGVLKSLGASSSGVRSIFLAYGLSLGIVGSGVGMLGGLVFVHYINDIEKWLSAVTHRKVFDDSIYYFDKIPTLVDPFTVGWIVVGALLIAIAASVWPAHRAAKLHPVRALRYE
jgi:lipoprotein-releasing system permease protein